MVFSGIFKKSNIVGIEVGSSSVKLAQFRKKEEGFHLSKASIIEMVPCWQESGKEKELMAALSRGLKGIDIVNSAFVVIINCSKTAVKRILLPPMPKEEVHESIKIEAKKYFPFPINDVYLDFELLGEVSRGGVRKNEWLVATTQKQTVDRILAVLSKFNISPISFVPSVYALGKLLETIQFRDNKAKCFIDIGSYYTDITIFSGSGGRASSERIKNGLVFSRKVPIAGGSFTKALTTRVTSNDGSKLQISLEEAEKIKRGVGMSSEGEWKMPSGSISMTQIAAMLRFPLEQLINEIRRCLGFYREKSGAEEIGSLILLGAGSALKGLPEFLTKELGVKVELAQFSEEIKIETGLIKEDDKKLFYQLAAVFGAALGQRGGVNLIPPHIKEERKYFLQRVVIQSVIVVAIVISGFVNIGLRAKSDNMRSKLTAVQQDLESLQPKLKLALSNAVAVNEPYWEDTFKEMSNIIPSDTYLTEVIMQDGSIKLRGVVISGEAEKSLSEFINNMEKGMFSQVQLVFAKDSKEKKCSEFELDCSIE
jgi:type IV pilus assembly protein PilM